jgi:hypothetical protein
VVSVIADVDVALRELFEQRMTTLGAGTAAGVATGQIGIQPPDDDWVGDFGHFNPPQGLNVYLVDVVENRRLRTNERLEHVSNGVVYRDPAPLRVDCHFLITAWSGGADRKEKTVTEHRILAEALEVLAETRAITVAGVELPTSIAPPEGFPKLAEFWGTMGAKHPWRPAVQLVVTVPVEAASEVAGPEVTTRFIEYGDRAHPGTGELRVQIAGVVRDASVTPTITVPRVWVRLESAAGVPVAKTKADTSGRFTFVDVEPGTYALRVRAEGRAELLVTPITVPSASGRYDLEFP